MNLIDDATLVNTYGAETIDRICALVQPAGDCVACQRPLGDGAYRLVDQLMDDRAILSAVHASCGTHFLLDGALLLPNATWLTWAFVMQLTNTTRRRTWWGRRYETHEQEPFAVFVINATTDVFHLRKIDGAWFEDSAVTAAEHGFTTAGDTPFHETNPHLAGLLRDGDLTVQFGVGVYSLDVSDEIMAVARQQRGFLVALSAASIDEGREKGPGAVLRDPYGLFSWLDASQIENFT